MAGAEGVAVAEMWAVEEEGAEMGAAEGVEAAGHAGSHDASPRNR
jgi:hypothetical protein